MRSLSRAAWSALVALVVAAPLALAVPATAHPHHHTQEYDALGDSYASGYGVPPYTDLCGRSATGAYPVLLDAARLRVELDDFVACAGATTASLVAGGQLEALDRRTDLVTLTIGGNDIGWSAAVTACLGGTDEACATTLASIRQRVRAELPRLLHDVYRQVDARAPKARVLVTGYPRLFSPEAGAYLGASAAEQRELNKGADLLNRVIRKAARQHGFEFVDVTRPFLGHGVNAAEPWILGPGPASFHPTLDGYEAYAAAVARELRHPRHHGHGR